MNAHTSRLYMGKRTATSCATPPVLPTPNNIEPGVCVNVNARRPIVAPRPFHWSEDEYWTHPADGWHARADTMLPH